ncbi:MAG: hydrogenase maturation nickel metallochaperone HypA [Armatimonadota bacterium]|nr:hydrogenase maturation nickel metallochaperone HypA [Armatimonadota bacterium]MDR7450500.1 hydrogenase maturation nickel metallochaperone HypA [Armatimonadota bacterium]MDR7466366.1 hydrogenase maturation nickel metallochaperone HypA [Armatimonadota bacterium]MDR7493088.1 hydrogenase maturation nickel metallochaperone HypA [Armatimonadota bacterium]MDR7498155.1 hydrogenase maturation nickel metallochaperone HypA [Armatimonadota bacterium]
MHELGLTESILKTALDEAARAGATAVRGLHLVLSSASHIEPETVRQHFAVISRGTPAEGAELSFTIREVVETCRICGRTFVVHHDEGCPHCGTPALAVDQEDELRLESLDLDVPAA